MSETNRDVYMSDCLPSTSRDAIRSSDNSVMSSSDLITCEEQRDINVEMLYDQLSDGYSRSCSTEDSNVYIENNGTNVHKPSSTQIINEPEFKCSEQILENGAEQVVKELDDAPGNSQKKKDEAGISRLTAQQRKHLDVLQALTDPENRKKAFEGLVAAIQNDINKRFFMHEEKLRKFRAILAQNDKTKYHIIHELDEVLGEEDRELVFIVACLTNDDDIINELSEDAQFSSIQKALTMIMDVQAYVYGTRGLKTLKRIAANFRNEKLNDGEKLKSILKNLFRRDDKLYKLFIPDEPYDQQANNERFERVNLSNVKSAMTRKPDSVLFETVELPYERPKLASMRPQPQLQHGNIVIEMGGSETVVDVRYDFNRTWSAAEDNFLLEEWKANDLDYQLAAQSFSLKNSHVVATEAYQRLLDMHSTMR